MATIQLVRDNIETSMWWMTWVEKGEVIGSIVQDSDGRCRICPQGPHWSPMKSFAGFASETPQQAVVEVELYFRDR
jgi:hypothetical protein